MTCLRAGTDLWVFWLWQSSVFEMSMPASQEGTGPRERLVLSTYYGLHPLLGTFQPDCFWPSWHIPDLIIFIHVNTASGEIKLSNSSDVTGPAKSQRGDLLLRMQQNSLLMSTSLHFAQKVYRILEQVSQSIKFSVKSEFLLKVCHCFHFIYCVIKASHIFFSSM